MSDKPISVGDLVMLVKGCCQDAEKHLGWVGTVEGVLQTHSYCHCGDSFAGLCAIVTIEKRGDLPLRWLKRIPPLEELDEVKRDEEITA